MASQDSKSVPSTPLGAPRELILVAGAGLGLFVAAGCGALLSSYVPDNSPWLFAAAYGAPTAVVFTIYWLISRRL
jgi:hypothetical protein